MQQPGTEQPLWTKQSPVTIDIMSSSSRPSSYEDEDESDIDTEYQSMYLTTG